MHDEEFAEELVSRINDLLDKFPHQINEILCTPIRQRGCLTVGQFIGQLGLPVSTPLDTPESFDKIKVILPVVQEDVIVKLELVLGSELTKKAQEFNEKTEGTT